MRQLLNINENDRDLVLELLRLVSRRVREIDQEVTVIGTALAQNRITPRMAIDWSECVAPGCIAEVHLSLIESPEIVPSEAVA